MMQASSRAFEISTPQMIFITVTYVRLRSSDCSVVRDNGEDPRLTHGCCRRGIGRHRRALWPVATGQSAKSLPSHILLDMQIQGVAAEAVPEWTPHPNPLPQGEREFTSTCAIA